MIDKMLGVCIASIISGRLPEWMWETLEPEPPEIGHAGRRIVIIKDEGEK
jgi:hypothetical protein